MKVRIAVAESSKVVELEVDDLEVFKETMKATVEAGDVFWTTDTKGREFGIPAGRIAFVEVESENADVAVGFAPGNR
ncbi:hypothetical protein BH23ACT4_BH23ACT4_08970 [soil metagenome]